MRLRPFPGLLALRFSLSFPLICLVVLGHLRLRSTSQNPLGIVFLVLVVVSVG